MKASARASEAASATSDATDAAEAVASTSSSIPSDRADGSRPSYVPPDERPRDEVLRPERQRGQVLDWIGGTYGFIRPDDMGANVFVHRSNVAGGRELAAGDHVEFALQPADESGQANRAVNVRLVGKLPQPPPRSAPLEPPTAVAAPTAAAPARAKPALAAFVPRNVAARGGKRPAAATTAGTGSSKATAADGLGGAAAAEAPPKKRTRPRDPEAAVLGYL